MTETPHLFTQKKIREIYDTPLLDLIYRAASVHRQHNNHREIQISSLVSVKTGGCSEDCGYCPQSAHHGSEVEVHPLLEVNEVLQLADKAKASGASRLCLGAAWREVRDNRDFERVLEMVKGVSEKGMEVCCTLGMLTESQAQKLADAGLHAYNHNLDTSEEHYKKIITTRNYDERLQTIDNVRKAKITVCSGGIIGMGESIDDRISMLHTLASMNPPPESIPINALVPVKGTPLENLQNVSTWEMVRMIATTRIVMPKALVRLSAGRTNMPAEAQALCFLAGANSIFAGDKLLTTPNPSLNADMEMLKILGLNPQKIDN